jgi:hypothetical protein
MGIPYTLNDCETAPSHIRDSMWSVQIWIYTCISLTKMLSFFQITTDISFRRRLLNYNYVAFLLLDFEHIW